jgi:putative transposase
MGVLRVVAGLLRVLLAGRARLVAEDLALRQQLTVLQRSVRRPKLRRRDRFFWVLLSRLWSRWRSCLLVVKPETVIRWHP